MSNLSLLITAGPTRAWIDEVRFITNASSGKMGYALYREAILMGLKAKLIMGSVPFLFDNNVNSNGITFVETNEELSLAIKNNITNNTLLIMAAAPLDFVPSIQKKGKIKKEHTPKIKLVLKQYPDILMEISSFTKEKNYRDVYLVGFSADTSEHIENAKKKLIKKGLFAIVINDVSRKDIGFFSDYNEVTILYKDGSMQKIDKSLKTDIAKKIIENLLLKLNSK
jgi:phosphopantothenoylcysteine decarboxylase/phosphopantothenate--cysteine ligase